MPRAIFVEGEELLKWCGEFVKGGNYIMYLTGKNELILEPRRSTRPLRYAYLKEVSKESADKLVVKIHEKFGIPFMLVSSYEWDVEKSVGVKVRVE